VAWTAILTLFALTYLLTVVWFIPRASIAGIPLNENALVMSGSPFGYLMFLGFLPVLNAVSDWISVNFTRWMLRININGGNKKRLENSRIRFAWMVIDFAVALVLCLLVYFAVFVVLQIFSLLGWQGIDVQKILKTVQEEPWSSQSNWLLLLSITNFLPTAIHLGLWASSKVSTIDPEKTAELTSFLAGGHKGVEEVIPIIKEELFYRKYVALVITAFLSLIFFIFTAWLIPRIAGHALEHNWFGNSVG
jgi:hypothetical protein